MSKIFHQALPATVSTARFPAATKWLSALLVLTFFTALGQVKIETPDERYLKAYHLIQEGDALAQRGDVDLAKTNYHEARTALQNLTKTHPNWNTKAVAYRINYTTGKIAALSPAPRAVADASSQAPPEIRAAAAPAKSPVTLLDPGAEPRTALRIRAEAAGQQTVSMTMQLAVDMGLGQAMKMPATEMIMDVTVKSVSANGDMTYETVIRESRVAEEPGAMPQVVEAMKASMAGLNGMSVAGTMSNRGISKGTRTRMPPGVNPQVRQAMEQMTEAMGNMSLALPEEPVGPGARWEVKEPFKQQGMTIDQTSAYELISIDGDRVNLKASIRQHAANQKIANPAMPGMKVDMTQMTGTGTGVIQVDLTQLMPSQATLDSRSEMSMAMNMGGQKQEMTVKTDLKLVLETK